MKISNTILSLESIPKATIYSKYGESLDKLFKSRSLKNLLLELKNPKKFISKEFENTEESPKKKVVNKYKEEDFKDIFTSLEKEQENKKEQYIKEANKKLLLEKEKEKEKNKIRLFINSKGGYIDPFKYNPNYNSISKKIPSVRMILNEKELKELNEIKAKDKERQKSSKLRKNKKFGKIENLNTKKVIPKVKNRNEESFLTLLNENNKKFSRNNSSKKREQPSLPPLYNIFNQKEKEKEKEKERALTLENDHRNRNNHALRFSKYISRKMDFNNKDNLDKISYLEPYDYLNNKNNNSIDFRKMAYRRDKDLINSYSLGIPSIYDYNPKYDLVEKKVSPILFTPHNDIKNTKQYLLRKLWVSYEVTSDYKLIDKNKI